MADDLERFAVDLRTLASGLTGEQMRKALDKVGVAAKGDAVEAARVDLGSDRAFSGWKRVGPLEARYSLHKNMSGLTVHRAPRSAGPWRVAEQGRNQGNASGFQGPGVNRETGLTSRTSSGRLRRVRARQARRWNGRTVGKDTWTDAERLMERRTPARLMEAMTDVMRKGLGLG